MTNQPWKLVLLLTGIFIAGAVTGSFVTMKIGRHMMPRPPSPEAWGPARLKKLSEKLNLSSEQQEKVRPIMQRDMKDLARIRTSSFAEGKLVIERMERDISEILTPEQRAKFEQMNREMRERIQRFVKDRPYGLHGEPRERDHPRGPGAPGTGDESAPAEKPPGGT